MLKCKREKYKIIELDIRRERKRISESKTKKNHWIKVKIPKKYLLPCYLPAVLGSDK